MAVCGWCQQEMTEQVGCTLTTYDDFADGVPRQRIRRGAPGDLFADLRGPAGHPKPPPSGMPPETLEEWGTWPEHCRDCGVPLGAYHHPGCDSEACPNCGAQAIACDCPSTANDEAVP